MTQMKINTHASARGPKDPVKIYYLGGIGKPGKIVTGGNRPVRLPVEGESITVPNYVALDLMTKHTYIDKQGNYFELFTEDKRQADLIRNGGNLKAIAARTVLGMRDPRQVSDEILLQEARRRGLIDADEDLGDTGTDDEEIDEIPYTPASTPVPKTPVANPVAKGAVKSKAAAKKAEAKPVPAKKTKLVAVAESEIKLGGKNPLIDDEDNTEIVNSFSPDGEGVDLSNPAAFGGMFSED